MNSSNSQKSVNVKKRLELFGMFYPLERKYERRWAKIFKSNFNVIVEKFKEISQEKKYEQEEINNQIILWRNVNEESVECMFYFIKDVANLLSVQNCFKLIAKYDVYLTYAIVHQKKDGENNYDIFRFSKFSYLEHCNRVRYPVKK
jgi:hypothetical protein